MNRWRVLALLGVIGWLTATAASVWSQSRDAHLRQGSEPHVVQGGSLAVLVSPTGNEVWAYSKYTGTWHLQSLRLAPDQPIQPIVGDEIAMFHAGTQVYAFSAVEGRWDVLDIETEAQVRSHVGPDWCMVIAGRSAHAFSSLVPQWASVDVRRRPGEPVRR